MKYSTHKNPLAKWWRLSLYKAKKANVYIYPEWKTWIGFALWANKKGYDENTELVYHTPHPFCPSSLGKPPITPDYEYIAYEVNDPYELIVASASTAEELSEILTRMGYSYTPSSIYSSLSRNADERPPEDRLFGLAFERIDLTNYDESED